MDTKQMQTRSAMPDSPKMEEMVKKMGEMMDKKLNPQFATLNKQMKTNKEEWKTDVQQLKEDMKNNKTELKKEIEQLKTTLESRLTKVETDIQDTKKDVKALKKSNEARQLEIAILTKKTEALEKRTAEAEQHSRKRSVRITGVPHNTPGREDCYKTVTKFCKDKLGIELQRSEIVATHRLRSTKAPKPILLVLTTDDVKARIIAPRKILKDSGMAVTEDLCYEYRQLVNRMYNDDRVSQTWTWNGRVYAKLEESERVINVQYGETLDDAIDRDDDNKQKA